MNVTIWNEFRHEQKDEAVRSVYPDGIHQVIADFLGKEHQVSTATLDEPEHGLTEELLNQTDVLVWWGHIAHHEVADEVVERVHKRVLEGMGLIVLHSGHFSKIF
ncbi:ThuA domain-containing protein, partial [Alkalihalobacillus clausii]